MRNWELRANQPAVTLATQLVLKSCGCDRSVFQILMKLYWGNFVAWQYFDSKFWDLSHSDFLSRALSIPTELSLLYYKARRNARLPASNKSGRRTYQEWNMMAAKICVDVVRPMSKRVCVAAVSSCNMHTMKREWLLSFLGQFRGPLGLDVNEHS